MDADRRSRVLVVSIVLLLLLALYVLGIGPLDALEAKGYIQPGSVAMRCYVTVYSPLLWLANNCEPFGEAIRWYARLWY
jgi:hypothetical protein